jgi:hypothetical protein
MFAITVSGHDSPFAFDRGLQGQPRPVPIDSATAAKSSARGI